MVQPGLAAWDGVDMSEVLDTGPVGAVPVLVGNDARLAGLAEARRGGLRTLSVALHLHLATGIGGVLLSSGVPLTGAHGAAGEFGHLPLTGGTESCRCSCVGCSGTGRRHPWPAPRVGRTEEGDRVKLALGVIKDAERYPGPARALTEVAGALGRGIGSLVNAHDPEAIGLSGLGRDVLTGPRRERGPRRLRVHADVVPPGCAAAADSLATGRPGGAHRGGGNSSSTPS